jgi:hypothetical protein
MKSITDSITRRLLAFRRITEGAVTIRDVVTAINQVTKIFISGNALVITDRLTRKAKKEVCQ